MLGQSKVGAWVKSASAPTLGHTVSDQNKGNILKRHDIPKAPQRKTKTTWTAFIQSPSAVLAATDFLSVDDFF